MAPYPKLSNSSENTSTRDPAVIFGEVGGDPTEFIRVLTCLVKARGVSKVAEQAGLGRESLYKTLHSARPRFETIVRILGALGLRLSVVSVSNPSDNEARLRERGGPGSQRQTTNSRRHSAPNKNAIGYSAQFNQQPSSSLATPFGAYAGGKTWVDELYEGSSAPNLGGAKIRAVLDFLGKEFPVGRPSMSYKEMNDLFKAKSRKSGASESTFRRAFRQRWPTSSSHE